MAELYDAPKTESKINEGERVAPLIGIYTEDLALLRKIALALEGEAEVVRAERGDGRVYRMLFVDSRRAPSSFEGAGFLSGAVVAVKRREECSPGEVDLPYPFAFSELRELVRAEPVASARLSLDPESRSAVRDGERIRLTESEYKLLDALISGGGDFVSREELVRGVFGESADGGILNVYVHYLREKLEGRGEKIILSSRRGGYRIDEKYLGVTG